MKAILFSFLLLTLFTVSCSTSTSKKTTKLSFNSGDLLYTDSITETQAKELGNYLVKKDFFDGNEKTVQLSRENDIIHFAMILNDSLINSKAYQNEGFGLVSELEHNVFKGSTVEVDYCDEYMKVKKNIKGEPKAIVDSNTDIVEAFILPDGEVNPFEFIPGYWVCTNITGGNVDAAQQARNVEILENNFTFEFFEDGSFTSQFINQNDLSTPLPVNGNFIMKKDNLHLTNLAINGKATDQDMWFKVKMKTGDQLQLIGKEAGVKDIVMTFERTQ